MSTAASRVLAAAADRSDATSRAALYILAGVALCGPTLLGWGVSPSATFFNQAIALAGWGFFLTYIALNLGHEPAFPGMPGRVAVRAAIPLLGLLALSVMWSVLFELLPGSLARSALGLMAAAAVTVLVGAAIAPQRWAVAVFDAVCVAFVVAGLLGVVMAVIQVFVPTLADGDWIARLAGHGRAGGNLRQPNHLSSLLLWAVVALMWLHDTRLEGPARTSRLPWRAATVAALCLLLLGDVLTVSRTAWFCLPLLVLWGALDRRLSRFSRILLVLVPVLYVLLWVGVQELTQVGGVGAFAGDTQLHKADPSSSRFGVWANAIQLIKANPWLGVGWGEFNFAWSLTPFPGRPTAFFDHTHNLPLQFLVEMGIPLGTVALALLLWMLWKLLRACAVAPESHRGVARAVFVMVLMIGVHSMFEYPLWYAYFLLPTAFMAGLGLGLVEPAPADDAGEDPAPPRWRIGLVIASIVLAVGALGSVLDYMRVSLIFKSDDDTPLSRRIEEGQRSLFFGYHADYAAATVANHPSTVWRSFGRAPHFLLDTRLMMAWARAYAEKGDVERARYLVERLREFRNPDADEFFAECEKAKALPAGAPRPFQCTPSTRRFTYEDFKQR